MGMSDEGRRNAAFFDSAILSNRAGGALPLSVSFLLSQPTKIHQILSRFLLRAMATASERFEAPSREKAVFMCAFTQSTPIPRTLEMSALVSPLAA